MMKNTASIILTSALLLSSAVTSQDQAQQRPLHCGPAPQDFPVIPNAETATTKQVVEARKNILAYSQKIDVYFTCMEQRTQYIKAYMSKDQLSRYENDMTDLNNKLRDAQIEMNRVIRALRSRR
ncbi:hypothetical protein QGN29_00670 [Temperatibacter marinus]|uniref:Uncharacterized protein n=1 Tax=Temperatibacter marinus TaxID=1456591 RepID=A0AA52H9G2_9PROT|nr:hypothetical protein [Temperatibacter marinus]WND02874.1 hypothetical protein QGN29_00670 [Temperatibacter marinus]